MKGILKKTEQGWVVDYSQTFNNGRLPLHPDSDSLYMFAELKEGWENNLEGKEVEFEVRVYPSNTSYAKIIYKEDVGHCAELDEGGCGLDCSYPDCICQGNEITDCKNRTPEQVVLGYKTALVEDVFHQELKKTAMQELFDNLEAIDITVPNGVKKIFLEKEKEQILDAHIEGQRVFDNYQHTQWTTDQAEQFYNETYKGGQDE